MEAAAQIHNQVAEEELEAVIPQTAATRAMTTAIATARTVVESRRLCVAAGSGVCVYAGEMTTTSARGFQETTAAYRVD